MVKPMPKEFLRKLIRHHDVVSMIEKKIDDNHFLEYPVSLEFYTFYRGFIFMLYRIFNEYGIKPYLPIIDPVCYPWDDFIESAFYEVVNDFPFDAFTKFKWKLAEVGPVEEDINQEAVDACISMLPDCKSEEFDDYRAICNEYGRNFDVIDYFAFLYYPGLGQIETWLEAVNQEKNTIRFLYQNCIKRMEKPFKTDYINHKGFFVNDNFYIPLVMSYNQYDSSDCVMLTQFQYGSMFDAYILSTIHDWATERVGG